MNNEQLHELLYQALETEQGGIAVYDTAVKCAVNDDLRSEWEEYLEQTRRHEHVMRRCSKRSASTRPSKRPADGRPAHRRVAGRRDGDGAGIGAARGGSIGCGRECRECRDEGSPELGVDATAAEKASGSTAKAIAAACDEVEDEEDEHLYHTMGWTRELWMESLGMPAVLPPPEEQKGVKTAIGAARAKNAREDMAKEN